MHYFISKHPNGPHKETPSIQAQFLGTDLTNCEGIQSLGKHCNSHIVHSYHFSITERQPFTFSYLRQQANIDLLASLNPADNDKVLKRNIGNRGGRSAAFIFVTHDKRLVLKTITKTERVLLTEQVLCDYVNRVRKESVLARILGVYTLRTSKGLKQHIAVMENILFGGEIAALFDMKGSRLARKTLKHNEEVAVETLPSYETYKDLDFFQTQKRLFLANPDQIRLRKAIASDVELLRSHGIMDYSLLIGIGKTASVPHSPYLYPASGPDQGRVYYIGIIDYLQLYSRQKQLEGLGKSLLSNGRRDEVSSVDPQTYARRFIKLVEQVLGIRETPRASTLSAR